MMAPDFAASTSGDLHTRESVPYDVAVSGIRTLFSRWFLTIIGLAGVAFLVASCGGGDPEVAALNRAVPATEQTTVEVDDDARAAVPLVDPAEPADSEPCLLYTSPSPRDRG